MRDILDSLAAHGFKRIIVVNGHAGNTPAQAACDEWLRDHAGVRPKWHNWWNAPRTWAKVMEIDPVASHASWMENFPWTRLMNAVVPDVRKPMIDPAHVKEISPIEVWAYLGDGNYGGRYQRADEEMQELWQAGVEETRAVIAEGWA